MDYLLKEEAIEKSGTQPSDFAEKVEEISRNVMSDKNKSKENIENHCYYFLCGFGY